MVERTFNKEFKNDVLKMKTGEDWNKLKEKYGKISAFQWDNEMKQHFNDLLGKYSDYEVRKK